MSLAGRLLVTLREGAPGARPLVVVHGFGGAPSMFEALLSSLLPRIDGATPVLGLVLPGHGADPLCPGDTFDEVCGVIAAERASLERASVIAYSMGARVALGVATQAPWLALRLVLVGVHPGLERDDDRAARKAWDDDQASHLERAGLASFFERWQEGPLFATQRSLGAEVLEQQRQARLSHTAAGLAWAMRTLGLSRQPPLWGCLRRDDLDLLVVAGGLDEKFCGLAEQMRERGPSVRLARVEGAGHNVALEAPEALAALAAREINRAR